MMRFYLYFVCLQSLVVTVFLYILPAVAVHRDSVTRSYVSSWRSKGVRVFTWTVNNNIEKAYFRHVLGVTCLTDTLDRSVL